MWSWLKASEFQPHHLYNCILPHEKKVVLAPTPTPTSLSLPRPQPFQQWMTFFFRVQGVPTFSPLHQILVPSRDCNGILLVSITKYIMTKYNPCAPLGTCCWRAFNTLKRVFWMIKYLMLCSIYFVWRQFQTGVVYVKKNVFFPREYLSTFFYDPQYEPTH